MSIKLETYITEGAKDFRNKGIKPTIIRVKDESDSKPESTSVINYEFTMHGIFFRVPKVRVLFEEDIEGPLFTENVDSQIDKAIFRARRRQDRKRNNDLI